MMRNPEKKTEHLKIYKPILGEKCERERMRDAIVNDLCNIETSLSLLWIFDRYKGESEREFEFIIE